MRVIVGEYHGNCWGGWCCLGVILIGLLVYIPFWSIWNISYQLSILLYVVIVVRFCVYYIYIFECTTLSILGTPPFTVLSCSHLHGICPTVHTHTHFSKSYHDYLYVSVYFGRCLLRIYIYIYIRTLYNIIEHRTTTVMRPVTLIILYTICTPPVIHLYLCVYTFSILCCCFI